MLDSSALTLSIALAAGLVAQVAATHLRLPGLVLLLATGVLLGPDVANVVRPEVLGDSLHTLVGFAVAVILFEGGLGLDIKRLQRENQAVRQLITVGALVTAVGGTLAARLALGWSWRISALFGTLVIVTGPTVVTPLLRRLNVKHGVATVLEAEGVLIDAIGAITAAVALEVALRPSGEHLAEGVLDIAMRLGLGIVFGVIGGLVIALPLRVRKVVPEGLENVFSLGIVLAVFQLSNAVVHESGIAAVVVSGILVRNAGTHVERELREFKKQLTVMLIGMLFVLLAADVRIADIVALGGGGVLAVAAVIFIVRPANVLAGTLGTKLTWRERTFVAWVGPRGIVAAAVASLFVGELDRAGIEGGAALRALVFLVIAASVLWSGLSGGIVASLLGLRRKQNAGWVILGAGRVARTLASLLDEGGDEVICIESNPRAVHEAETEGIRVIFGNGLEERTLRRAEIDTRAGVIGITPDENTNALFLERVKRDARHIRRCMTLERWEGGVTPTMVHEEGGEVLFGGSVDIGRWGTWLEAGDAQIEWWCVGESPHAEGLLTQSEGNAPYLPLVTRSGASVAPVTATSEWAAGDELGVVVDMRRREEAVRRLHAAGLIARPSPLLHVQPSAT